MENPHYACLRRDVSTCGQSAAVEETENGSSDDANCLLSLCYPRGMHVWILDTVTKQ